MSNQKTEAFTEEEMGLLEQASGSSRGKRFEGKSLAVVLLGISNALLAYGLLLAIYGSQEPSSPPQPESIAIIPDIPRKPMQFHWYTPYSSANSTEADELWDAINTAHGHIAVDHKWAEENHWTKSMPVPGDETKGLYLLESYHQFHCLKIVRKVLHEAVDGKPLSYPLKHANHCFDYFRQFVTCHADNTPLYTVGAHTAGDGQVHMCRDWKALRDYATQNSACFRDRTGTETVREQFGHCDGGVDGIPWPGVCGVDATCP